VAEETGTIADDQRPERDYAGSRRVLAVRVPASVVIAWLGFSSEFRPPAAALPTVAATGSQHPTAELLPPGLGGEGLGIVPVPALP
jgi:hypothetical protein